MSKFDTKLEMVLLVAQLYIDAGVWLGVKFDSISSENDQ